ncbi:hypothetical protein [Calothrix sp. NIES-2098]|uniref:hypothetical protein n=1 Tax=Calothrix sp. NIES-2098 TaxID=1954171 RepID=UPI000B5E6154|nr:hypothetical protein NIES2098_40090 [Calothrix sp. NIES-2098]
MNCCYFACIDCKKYIDAGYRWAYWLLENPGIIDKGERISAEQVFHAEKYWQPPPDESSPWLIKQILPAVHRFLSEHQQHCLLYLDEDNFAREDSIYYDFQEIEIECDRF